MTKEKTDPEAKVEDSDVEPGTDGDMSSYEVDSYDIGVCALVREGVTADQPVLLKECGGIFYDCGLVDCQVGLIPPLTVVGYIEGSVHDEGPWVQLDGVVLPDGCATKQAVALDLPNSIDSFPFTRFAPVSGAVAPNGSEDAPAAVVMFARR